MNDLIILSSRVRLARNLAGTPFPTWADQEILAGVGENVFASAQKQPEFADSEFHRLDSVDPIQVQVWAESHLVSPDFARQDPGRFLIIGGDEKTSIMVNEEDHLRIQAFVAGSSLERAWNIADRVDDGLERDLDFAFSEEIGYLTACPTNAGTGMRASFMLHLPALMMTGQAQQLIASLSQIGIVTRGLFGEGTQAIGNIFQISNATTLGRSEKEIIENLNNIGSQVVDRERAARKGLIAQAKDRFADQSYRALGILSNCRMITFQEALELISMVRLGVETGILSMIDFEILDRLWMVSRPAHLELLAGRSIGNVKEESARADAIRGILTDGIGK